MFIVSKNPFLCGSRPSVHFDSYLPEGLSLLIYEKVRSCLTCTSPSSKKEKIRFSFILSKGQEDKVLKVIKPHCSLLIVKGIVSRRRGN